MDQQPFYVRAEQLLERIFEQLEALDELEDLDLVEGILRFRFEDGGQVIINRQEPVEQIWLASPLGPAHFGFDAASGQWLDVRSRESLHGILERLLSTRLGRVVHVQM